MRRRVMLWGLSGDPPLESVRRELILGAVPHVLFDQRSIRQARLDLDTVDGIVGRLTLGSNVIDVNEIGAIFVRPHDIRRVLRESRNEAPTAEVQHAATALQEQFFAWTDITDALVVNRPSAMVSNSSKPYQAELIRWLGFEIPATLVTTTPGVVLAFVAQHEQVIYKSVSDARSIVTRLDAPHLEHLDDVVNCPTQFQAYVAGTDWRVHVVGDDVYACEIQCAADDYRCADQQGIAIDIRSAELPEPIVARCRSLAQFMNLPLAGIDLRRTADDRWYCFEVNPAPAFTYYEQATGQPLSAAVARLLSEHYERSPSQPVESR